MTERSVTVIVPGTPSKALSPNKVMRRGGHYAARDAEALLRRDAMFAAYSAIEGMNRPVFTCPVEMTQRIVWGKGERRTDLSAVPLMLKAVEDGLCDALVMVNDAQVKRITVLDHGKDKDGPGWIEVTITAAGEGVKA